MLFYPKKPGILRWAHKLSSYVLAWISLVSKMELSQPSPHSAVVKINAPTVLEKVKAAVMSNLEESVANTGTSVFRAGLGQ